MERQLEGKCAIVTGSSKGIGRAIALEFARAGAKVAINYNKSKDDAYGLKKEIDRAGGSAIVVGADVTRFEEAARLVKESVKAFGRIDILVNNAGTTLGRAWGDFEKTDEESWDVVMDQNFKSVLACTNQALPHMIKERYGRIINVISESGIVGNKNNPVYAASKAAALLFTRSLAMQVVAKGITVNCIAPGATQTRAADLKLPGKPSTEDYVKDIPMGRMASTEEIGRITTFMASKDMDYMTGQYILVDGGWTL